MKSFTDTIVFKIIIINLVIFLLEVLFPPIVDIFGLNPAAALGDGMVWQFFTFMFIHGDFFHVFFNMFALMMFGPKIELMMGSKKFLKYYLICGVGSGLFHTLIYGINDTLLIGASGAVFGVLTAYGLMFPRDIVFFQFIPMPAIVFIVLYGFIELVYGISGAQPGIANFGHLGGMIVGFLLMRYFGFRKQKEIIYFWE